MLASGLGHVLGAEIDGFEVLEELILRHPEHAVVCHLWIARLLHFRELGPAWPVVVPLAGLELSFAPWVAYFDQVPVGSAGVAHAAEDGVRMAVHDTVCVLGIGAGLGAATHDVILVVP